MGVTGELYLGGVQLARGYLKRGGMTAERFVPDHMSGRSGGRLYRTGDLGRYLEGGVIEFLGRTDHQVKLRGYRIELGEIESVLEQCAGVKLAAVVVREEEGEKWLVAYVVCKEQEGIGLGKERTEEWREQLKSKLPDYMVPAVYVSLPALPLTSSGKLDRNALPDPSLVGQEESTSVSMSELEEVLAGIWAELLHVSRVNREDDFFHLGGHSLLATQVLARVRSIFHVDVSLRSFLGSPQLRSFASEIERLLALGCSHRSDPIPRSEHHDVVSVNQEGRLLREWWAAVRGEPCCPLNTNLFFEIQGNLNVDVLEESLNVLVQRHEVFRTYFPFVSGKASLELLTALEAELADPCLETRIQRIAELGSRFFKQDICKTADRFKLSIVDLENLPDGSQQAETYRIALEESRAGFDYEKPPLLHAKLLHKNATHHLLLLVAPHLVLDRWSAQIISRELSALYTTIVLNQQAHPPCPQVEYADFARWQRNHLQGGQLSRAVSYWKDRWLQFPLTSVEDIPSALGSSWDDLSPLCSESKLLAQDLCDDLRRFARGKRITLYMLFLAILKLVLHLYTGIERIGVWGYFANRTHPALEDVVGWIANAQLLGVEITPGTRVVEVLDRVRETVLEADANQEVPFSLVWLTCLPELKNHDYSQRLAKAISFDMIVAPRVDDSHPGLAVQFQPITLFSEVSELPMNLLAIDDGEQITLTVRYSSGKMSPAAVRSLLDDFEKVLQLVLSNPTAYVSQFQNEIAQKTSSLKVACHKMAAGVAGSA
ncbi:MAG TPA: condensation domain-containing protein, partial [Candidatus Angelobacter sp.]